MARENEYLTSNRRIRYPLADNAVIAPYDGSSESSSPCAWTDAMSSTVFGCFVDALVQLKSAYSATVPRVGGISLSGHTLSFSVVGSDGEAPVLLTCTRSTTEFPVISGESDWCWYTFVLSSAGIRECEEMGLDGYDIRGNRLPLSIRCVGASSPGVTEIAVYGGEQTDEYGVRYTRAEALLHEPDVTVSGDVSFKEGYNVSFSSEDSGFSISASPGSGAGVAPCGCEESEVIFKTPGLLSQDGHVRLFNDTCYDLVPSVFGNDGELTLNVKCKACCTCGMYASIVNDRLIPLRDRLLSAKNSISDTLTTYEENVAKWNARIATATPEDIVITSTGAPVEAAATALRRVADVSGKLDRCGFSVLMRNDAFVSVRMEMDSFIANGQPFEAQVSYMRSSSEPVVMPVDLTSKWRADTASSSSGSPNVVQTSSGESGSSEDEPIFSIVLEPGRSAMLTYFVRLDNLVKTDHQSGFVAKFKLSAYQGDRLVTEHYGRIGI